MTATDTFIQVRHRCLGCRRSWASASRLREHVESGCRRDPGNRSCKSCRHYHPGSPGGYEEPPTDPWCAVGEDPGGGHPDEMPMQCPKWEGWK